MKKLYSKHLWISIPDVNNHCRLGLSQFAKNYLVRLKRLEVNQYFKTSYGLRYPFMNELFLERIKGKTQDELASNEKINYDRFAIRKNEPFCKLITAEFDIQLSAPLQMRVIQMNFNVFYYEKLFQQEWFFQMEVLKPEQLESLKSEQDYIKQKKFFDY